MSILTTCIQHSSGGPRQLSKARKDELKSRVLAKEEAKLSTYSQHVVAIKNPKGI
jgi:hypothetical protein